MTPSKRRFADLGDHKGFSPRCGRAALAWRVGDGSRIAHNLSPRGVARSGGCLPWPGKCATVAFIAEPPEAPRPRPVGNTIAARDLRAKPHDGEHTHIHHIDGDPCNCRPRNLVLLTEREHWALHSDKRRKAREKARRMARQGVGLQRRK